ncbi:CcdB family protein [Sphingomonas mucosissima]|uniref:Toxin CcdB n=1 Tax=Sphingomonas mucosissima TaxID=370959 RepID=A0A245ZPN0_9SPHN|nr:CcdB family protein [Sphingomonas mucosissima]OWK31697.1 CcdB protein [Sphingomonas mucosissima]
MAKFDVFRTSEGWLALDCQSNSLSHLNTRLAVPLMPLANAPLPAARLNPRFVVDAQEVVMVTQFAAALPISELRHQLCRLDQHDYEISNALDMLISGF